MLYKEIQHGPPHDSPGVLRVKRMVLYREAVFHEHSSTTSRSASHQPGKVTAERAPNHASRQRKYLDSNSPFGVGEHLPIP